MSNVVIVAISNCAQCPNHYKERIYTPDSFEHEEGLYCSYVSDPNSYNKKHKLVASDDVDVTKYSEIPIWCPRLKKELTEKTINKNIPTIVLVGGTKCYKSTIADFVEKEIGDVRAISITRLFGPKYQGKAVNIRPNLVRREIEDLYETTYSRAIIMVEAKPHEVNAVKEICNQYDNCKMFVSTFDPNTFTITDINNLVNEIVDYFKNYDKSDKNILN